MMPADFYEKLRARPGSLFVIAGPCVIEDDGMLMEVSQELSGISQRLGIPMVFKSSYDKANRTSGSSFRGPGFQAGLKSLDQVREKTGLPILSDVHTPEEAKAAGKVLDFLQIPAFLCRQTDLLVSAALTGKGINIKKGQFVAPWDMKHAVRKVSEQGNERILVTERGYTFGYNNLVVDMRAIPQMKTFGYPVVFDATHSVQLPGGAGSASSGERQYIPHLARAAVAAGCDGLFMEVHPEPERALSDKETQLPLAQVESLLKELQKIANVVQSLETPE
ncbi:MAG: 3-deoxy-8-phosphooctulonate synthase [Nitrospirae bacterium]|nr:3-deoxy-8-phosphooctulonate synthase [Nitrospirota bacterium]